MMPPQLYRISSQNDVTPTGTNLVISELPPIKTRHRQRTRHLLAKRGKTEKHGKRGKTGCKPNPSSEFSQTLYCFPNNFGSELFVIVQLQNISYGIYCKTYIPIFVFVNHSWLYLYNQGAEQIQSELQKTDSSPSHSVFYLIADIIYRLR